MDLRRKGRKGRYRPIGLSAYRLAWRLSGDYQTFKNNTGWKMMKMLSWIFLDTLNHSNLWGSLRHCFFDGSVAEFGLFTETVAGHSATSATTRPTRSHGHLPGSACNHRMLESVWINGYQHSLKVTIYIYIYIYNWITSRRPMLGPQAEI